MQRCLRGFRQKRSGERQKRGPNLLSASTSLRLCVRSAPASLYWLRFFGAAGVLTFQVCLDRLDAKMLPELTPMRLMRQREAFDHPDWLFEVKFDGFRALAYVELGRCWLVSRNKNVFKRFEPLQSWIGQNLALDNAILDGELVCLDDQGRSLFYPLLFRRQQPIFYAFDLIWLNGQDLRQQPLLERKSLLQEIVPAPVPGSKLLYLDHIEGQGLGLFRLGCQRDLEGIVAKPRRSPYRSDSRQTCWIKIKNPAYSQLRGRREIFNNFRR